eukprot:g15990.t1
MMWQMGGHSGIGSWNFVMHPVFAGKKVDPAGHYVRRWLPELRHLPTEYIHCPWSVLFGLTAATMVGRSRRSFARRHGEKHSSHRSSRTQLAPAKAAHQETNTTAVEDAEEDVEDIEDEDWGKWKMWNCLIFQEEDETSDLQARPKMELDRVLPEDELREDWVMPRMRPKGKRTIRPKSVKRHEWDVEDHIRDFGHNPWSSFALAPAGEKELVAKTWTHDARQTAAERANQAQRTSFDGRDRSVDQTAEARGRRRIGDDLGTGPAHSAYIEIRERWDGPNEEAVNVIVAEHMDITPEEASELVELGAVWYYDDMELKDTNMHPNSDGLQPASNEWVRIMEPMTIPIDTVLRVFPNPERFKTCYVEDWDERIKKDFVVVDKPPLLPCFAHVTNGKEVLHRCLADALRVRTVQEVELGMDDRNMTAMTHIDEEVSGLVILARHEKARLVCEHWLKDDKCVFEFVAICTKNLEKGVYRHFYMKTERLGAPVLNDKAVMPATVNKKVAKAAGLLPAKSKGVSYPALDIVPARHTDEYDDYGAVAHAVAAAPTLGGAVDPEILEKPYGYMLQLLPEQKLAASRGIPQTPRTKVPVALHLARVEFGGRVVTCAPPPYWPEGAAAAVAVQLTLKDIKTNITEYLVLQGQKMGKDLQVSKFNQLNKLFQDLQGDL